MLNSIDYRCGLAAINGVLDKGCLAHAILDVVQQEPLAEDSPLWQHLGITITPHISG